jgi:phospholipid/cholesterol/gamma-HCH transport system substrate-binding protein
MMARNLKVGLFVIGGLLFSAIVIFLIGDERRLFERSVDFTAKFSDVQGLKAGAPVRMGGVDVGHVSSVGYGGKAGDTTIYVQISIVRSESGRIKTDSVAMVAAKGLLGDKMIEITRGAKGEPIPPGKEIPSKDPDDMLGKVTGMAGKAEATLDGLQRVTESLANEQLQEDLRGSVASLNSVLKQIAEGEGYPHRFVSDKAEAERISHLVESLDKTAQELTLTLGEVRKVAARVETGPGFAHEVIYGDGPKKEIAQFGAAADEAAKLMKGVRDSDSLAHDVVYGGKGNGAEAIANVNAITADLRAITADLRKGKGTLGALLVDPSVYEDMKVLLGNVQRNDVLRALVRYSIKQDEKKPDVKVSAPK